MTSPGAAGTLVAIREGQAIASLSTVDAAADDPWAPGPKLAAMLDRVGARFRDRPFRASTPSFQHYEVDGLAPCRRSHRFPAFSITGPVCALNCAHCRAKILEPMIPAPDPATLDRLVREGIDRDGLAGFLLSGGSNRRNEVPFERYLPVVRALKHDHPELEIAIHTGLVDERRANLLAEAEVDVAMLDIIGAEATIREVYHLDRGIADFAEALRCLVCAGVRTVPHIVVGLNFGAILGEPHALEIIAAAPVETVILVVVMAEHTAPGRFREPDLDAVARFFAQARTRLADRVLLLGCARPHGRARRFLDLAALRAGFDGIAYPAEDVVALAHALGRIPTQVAACCGLARAPCASGRLG